MVKVKGLKEAKKKVDDLMKRIKKMDGTKNKLFPSNFLIIHSKFSTLDELFSSSGFLISSNEDLENIFKNEMEKKKFDQFIKNNTDFNNWEEMFKAANNEVETQIIKELKI
jgi:hypothetical protein